MPIFEASYAPQNARKICVSNEKVAKIDHFANEMQNFLAFHRTDKQKKRLAYLSIVKRLGEF